MRSSVPLVLVMAILVPPSCANLHSISRRSVIPNTSKNGNTAVHLDAQQRLVIFGPDGKYCAEASPDAMAAFAAALVLGVSGQKQVAVSLSNTTQSSIATIGLRTQSITLMRDALYRLCEATANNTLSPLSATQLLARSQDLTAVVVAVEQLTGVVAANQATLSGTANAQTSASLVPDAELLDEARKAETKRGEELARTRNERDAQQEKVTSEAAKVEATQKAYGEAEAKSPQPDNLPALRDQLNAEQQTLSKEQGNLEAINTKVANAEKSLAEAKQVRETIEGKLSARLTDASAGTTGAGQFSSANSRTQLSKEATAQIADAVAEMVTTVLKKDYTIDACMTLMTNPAAFNGLDQTQRDTLEFTLTQCQFLLRTKIEEAAKDLRVSSYGFDDSSVIILKALAKDPNLEVKLEKWVRKNFENGSVTSLLYGIKHANLRQRAIKELSIQ